MRNISLPLSIFFLLLMVCCQQEKPREKPIPSPSELVAKTIAYHDSSGNLYQKPLCFTIEHIAAKGSAGKSKIIMDYSAGNFYQKTSGANNEIVIERYIGEDSLGALLNGKADFTVEEAKKYSLDSAGIQYMGNYYRYLLRLPYSLQDSQVVLGDTINHQAFKGQDCYWLKVNYDTSIQREKWFYFFDPKTYRLLGGMYYYTDPDTDGGYSLFEGEVSANQIKFPQQQDWKYHKNDAFFGGDKIVSVEVIE